MKAAVFEKTGSLVLKDVPRPVLASEDHIIIQVQASSICGTDVHITADPPGYIATPNTILGHEFCGLVVEKGKNVAHLEIGDSVVVNPNNYCGVCVYCRKNLPNQCEHIEALGIDYDGSFAEYVCIHSKVAYPISKDVSPEVAACVEPLACALNGLNKVKIAPGNCVAVIGAGPIGMIIAMLLKKNGAGKIYVLETKDYRIDFANKLELGRTIQPLEENAADIIMAETGIGVDAVFDVTGSQINTAISLVRKGGTVVLFGVNKNAVAKLAQCEITTKEISVLGTWLANATFPQAVEILEQNVIDMKALITDVIPLEELHQGIAKLAAGNAMKIIVTV